MKNLFSHSLNSRWLAGILIVAFVLAGAIVGYSSQLGSEPQGPSSYSVVNGPGGMVNGTGVPAVMRQVTFLSSTASSETEAAPAGTYATSFGGRMIELDACLTIQVDDVKAASDQASQVASSLGGYVASSYFDNSGPSASIVLRIPEANFSSAMRIISRLGVVNSQSLSSNDVTDQYVNLQAQLDSYTTEEATLLRILNSSTTVNDALDTENAIQNTQAQINYLEGQLLVMHRLVAFATINIELTQPAQPPKTPTLDFSDAFNSALLAFYTVTKGMLILGASLIPLAFVGGIIYVPYRHFSRKKPQPTGAK
jgi:hypothetical protein